jgi:hypothetical protein
VTPDQAHRALGDARTTVAVFEKLIQPVGGWDVCLCDAMREQGGPMGLLPDSPRESLLPLELEEALDQRLPVMMDYLDARQKRTQRVVEPIEIRRYCGELLLVAHCQLRNDRRNFKLERIVQLTRLAATTPEPAPVELECGLSTATSAPPFPTQRDRSPPPGSIPVVAACTAPASDDALHAS